MDQPVPSSELKLENVGKDAASPQSIVVEETAGCHCKPEAEPIVQEKVAEEVKEECPPAPPVCRDPPAEEPPKPEAPECPPCAPCPPCPEQAEVAPEAPPEVEEKKEEEEPDKFPRAPCPDPLYPPCKSTPPPCQQIVCPQDD